MGENIDENPCVEATTKNALGAPSLIPFVRDVKNAIFELLRGGGAFSSLAGGFFNHRNFRRVEIIELYYKQCCGRNAKWSKKKKKNRKYLYHRKARISLTATMKKQVPPEIVIAIPFIGIVRVMTRTRQRHR